MASSFTASQVQVDVSESGSLHPPASEALRQERFQACAGKKKKKKNLAWLPSLSNPKSIIPPTSLGRQVLRLKQEPEASYPTAETLYFEAKWNLFGRDPFCQLAMICEGMNRPLFSIFFFSVLSSKQASVELLSTSNVCRLAPSKSGEVDVILGP